MCLIFLSVRYAEMLFAFIMPVTLERRIIHFQLEIMKFFSVTDKYR
jgi:hypothetical protein